MAMNTSFLKLLVVFDRRLGCTDESASDEEQAEKILYYYPEDSSLFSQLSRLSMVESLIEFSAKFSTDAIDVVLTEGLLYGFYECEPDMWIALAVDASTAVIEQCENSLFYKHVPNSKGITCAIRKMYQMFQSMFGTISSILSHGCSSNRLDVPADSEAWKRIDHVAELRKQVRKLSQKEAQICQDIEVVKSHDKCDGKDIPVRDTCVEEENHKLGIKSGTMSLLHLKQYRDDTRKDIDEKRNLIDSIIGSKLKDSDLVDGIDAYSPSVASHLVSLFCRWYIQSGELFSLSGLVDLWGLHFSAFGKPSFFAIERIRSAITSTTSAIADTSVGSVMRNTVKSFIMYDGQVVWNDFFSQDIIHFYDFIRIQEKNSARDVSDFLEAVSNTWDNVERRNAFEKFQSLSRRLSIGRSRSELKQKFSQSEIDALNAAYQARKGFITSGWNTFDFMCSGSQSEVNCCSRQGQRLMNPDSMSQHYDSTENRLWCPRLFSAGCHDPEEYLGDERGNVVCLGRAVIYVQDRHMIVVVLPHWNTTEEFQSNLSASDVDIFSYCRLLQMNISAAITTSTEAELEALPSVSSSVSVDIGCGTSFVCCNKLNSAFKAFDLSRNLSPLLPITTEWNYFLKLLNTSVCAFPVSTWQFLGPMPTSTVASINDIVTAVIGGSDQYSVLESCTRVMSAYRGGIWVLGKKVGERRVLFVLEGCGSLSEVHDVMNKVTGMMLGSILL